MVRTQETTIGIRGELIVDHDVADRSNIETPGEVWFDTIDDQAVLGALTEEHEADGETGVEIGERGELVLPESVIESTGISVPGKVLLSDRDGQIIVGDAQSMYEQADNGESPIEAVMQDINEADWPKSPKATHNEAKTGLAALGFSPKESPSD